MCIHYCRYQLMELMLLDWTRLILCDTSSTQRSDSTPVLVIGDLTQRLQISSRDSRMRYPVRAS